jgi:CRP-like cAMP-binding protein
MLVFDILAIVPFNYLTNTSHRINTYFKILRLTRLLRLVKALKINKILESLTGGKEATYMAVNRLIICLVLIALLIHFTSCIWNFTVRLDNYSPDTWIVRKKQQDKSNLELYFDGIYFAVTTIFTVGFGDYSAVTELEKIICILLELVGIGFYSFVLGVTTSLLTSIDHKEILLQTKLSMMSLFCKDTILPKSIHKSTIRELKHHFENSILNDFERKSILSIIPKKIRAKIVSSMHQGRVFQIFFFRSQEKTFLSACIPRLNLRGYKAREVIFSQGDYPESMHFLLSGRVSFVFDERNFVFKTMISGSYFGEIGLIEKKPRDFGAVTCCPCEVLEMTGEVLREISEQFPSVFEFIRDVAKIKNLRNLQDRDDIIDLLDTVQIQKLKSYDQLAGRSSLICSRRKVVYPGDWFDYKHNLELQNKVFRHEIAVISN